MSREPKVMWSARLPGELVGQISEAAEEEGVSQSELVEQAMGEWFDARSLGGATPGSSLAEGAARAGLKRMLEYLGDRSDGATMIASVRVGEDDGAVVGAADPAALFADTVEAATIAGAAIGKRFEVKGGVR